MTTRIGVTGASGRMGQTVLKSACERTDCQVTFAVGHEHETTTSTGHEVSPAAAFPELLTTGDTEVVVDFTAPAATAEFASVCAEHRVGLVTGTTGLEADHEQQLHNASEEIPVLQAANFSRGIQALSVAVRDAVRALPGYDVEVLERHHNGKQDAPSGTALSLVERLEATAEFDGRTHSREGIAPRTDREIGIHAVRAGDVTGEHEVMIAGNHEEVRLVHRAEDRAVFAAGALDAADWLAGRSPGWYRFEEVVET